MIGRVCIACLLCAEAIALYTVAELIANGYADDRHAVAAWALVAAVVLAYLLPRLAGSFFVSERNASIALTVAAVVILYALMRIEYAHDIAIWNFGWVADFLRTPADTFSHGSHAMIGFFFLLTAWLWGAYRSNNEIEPELVTRTIAPPFIIVTILVVVGAGTDRSGEIGRAAIAFYVFDVLALVLAQLSQSGATFGSMRAGGVAGLLLAGTVGAVVAGLAAVTLLFAVIQPAFGPSIGSAIDHVLTWALTPVAWVFERLFSLLFSGTTPPKLQQDTLQAVPSDNGHSSRSGFETFALYLLRGLAILIVIAVIAAVVALVARLRRRRHATETTTLHVATAGSLGDDLGDLFRRMFHRPPRAVSAGGPDAATQLYLEVLQAAERRGASRPPAATPAEFAIPLQQTFPSAATDDITRAFEQARYAGRPPDEEAMRALRDRWQAAR